MCWRQHCIHQQWRQHFICHTTPSQVRHLLGHRWHDSFFICDMTPSQVRHLLGHSLPPAHTSRRLRCVSLIWHDSLTHSEALLKRVSHVKWATHIALISRHNRYVTYEWVMSHMNESCHIWMSHVTYEWVMSHMNESCQIWIIWECTSEPHIALMWRISEAHIAHRTSHSSRFTIASCQRTLTHSVCAYINIGVSLLTWLTLKRFWSATSSRRTHQNRFMSNESDLLKWEWLTQMRVTC